MIDFSKIKFAGMDCILVTIRGKCSEPILILDKADIERLNKEMQEEKK